MQKEPLSRSLKGRPFDHEQYFMILYPDVVGSGGAPKRITKGGRRKTAEHGGAEELETPGTGMMEMLADATYGQLSRQSIAAPPPPEPTPSMMPPHPTSAIHPPRASIASTSALTPPEENVPQTRKRLMPTDNAGNSAAAKRRRATSGADADPAVQAAAVPAADSIIALADFLRTGKPRLSWAEQALEIFFRDFADEDMDLQMKIAEKALADENKALVFCKMPATLRKHWVKRLREVHNRST